MPLPTVASLEHRNPLGALGRLEVLVQHRHLEGEPVLLEATRQEQGPLLVGACLAHSRTLQPQLRSGEDCLVQSRPLGLGLQQQVSKNIVVREFSIYANIANPAGGSYDSVAPVTTGSSNPPYLAFQEKDSAASNVTLHYQSISCMPAYRGSSFEVRD